MCAYLESDCGVESIAHEIEGANQRGIRAVPTFIFEREFHVPGAADADTFLRIFEQMDAMRVAADA